MLAKAKSFLGEAVMELKRVNWPARAQTIRLTLVVIAMSLLLAALLGLLDFVFAYLLNTFII